jgi:hypothetical protein
MARRAGIIIEYRSEAAFCGLYAFEFFAPGLKGGDLRQREIDNRVAEFTAAVRRMIHGRLSFRFMPMSRTAIA